jgi:hypothetical protein
MSTRRAQRMLATLWFVSFFVLSILMVLQFLSGKYGSEAGDALSWFFSSTVPVSLLMLGVFVANALAQHRPDTNTDPFMFWLAFGLCSLYLSALCVTFVWVSLRSGTPASDLQASNAFLLPIHGLMSAALGAFFVKNAPAGESRNPEEGRMNAPEAPKTQS